MVQTKVDDLCIRHWNMICKFSKVKERIVELIGVLRQKSAFHMPIHRDFFTHVTKVVRLGEWSKLGNKTEISKRPLSIFSISNLCSFILCVVTKIFKTPLIKNFPGTPIAYVLWVIVVIAYHTWWIQKCRWEFFGSPSIFTKEIKQ